MKKYILCFGDSMDFTQKGHALLTEALSGLISPPP